MKCILLPLFLAVGIAGHVGVGHAETIVDSLHANFQSPTAKTAPWVLWYWVSGNVTEEGITRDLEALAREGFGGVVMGDISYEEVIPGKVDFMSPEWNKMFSHALKECDRLGLGFRTSLSAGWCAAGGPWVKAKDSQQMLVWSKQSFQGQGRMDAPLPAPQRNEQFYRDERVLAFPSVDDAMSHLVEVVVESGKTSSEEDLTDGNTRTHVAFDSVALIEFRFNGEQTLSYVQAQVAAPGRAGLEMVVDVPKGARGWEKVASFSYQRPGVQENEMDRSLIVGNFGPVQTDRIRLRFHSEKQQKKGRIVVREIEIGDAPRIEDWIFRSGLGVNFITANRSETEPDGIRPIAKESILDLTEFLQPDGTLDYDFKEGSWTVLRMGHTSTGTKNRKATTGEGLEIDKFRPDMTTFHFNNYLGKLANTNKGRLGSPFNGTWLDSWESGIQQWSPVFIDQFAKLRGYDPTPWLPAMTGRVVGSYEESERFLWDVRRTIADLLANGFFAPMSQLCNKNQTGLWYQPLNLIGVDSFQAGRHVDGLEAATPFNSLLPEKERAADIAGKLVSSISHFYGKNLIATEFGTSWPPVNIYSIRPAEIKALADKAFVQGVNHLWGHVYCQQPWESVPGISLKQFGIQFQRHNTWFDALDGWSDYVSRSQFLLRQGLPMVDILVLAGETVPFGEDTVAAVMDAMEDHLPSGVTWDVCPASAISELDVRDGKLVLPSGQHYHALVLPDQFNREMRIQTADKIAQLVESGAVLIGNPPLRTPGLSNFPESDRQLRQIAEKVWGPTPSEKMTVSRHPYGRGWVYRGGTFGEALTMADCQPDFTFESEDSDAIIQFIHRQVDDCDIYLLVNRRDDPVLFTGSFRVSGKKPELWNALEGSRTLPSNWSENGSRTEVEINLEGWGSYFVLFRPLGDRESKMNDGAKRDFTAASVTDVKPTALSTQWVLNASPLNKSVEIVLPKPVCWTTLPELRYFSGTARYETSFEGSPDVSGSSILDLGMVHEIAEVELNGKLLGKLWRPPYRIDISEHVRNGTNQLVVKVTNLWANEMIGCARGLRGENLQFSGNLEKLPGWFKPQTTPTQPPTLFFNYQPYSEDADPLPSGLIGPVTLRNFRLHNKTQ